MPAILFLVGGIIMVQAGVALGMTAVGVALLGTGAMLAAFSLGAIIFLVTFAVFADTSGPRYRRARLVRRRLIMRR